jgi:hypothetical protein
MDETGIDFSQRDEDKLTVLDKRVGDLEFLGVNFSVIKEENVQIYGSRSPSMRLYPAQLRLDGLECSQEFIGF